MQSSEIRKKFLDFFEKHGHTIVPSSSLIPDDPSVLLTTAGMQQFKQYYSELNPEVTVHPSIKKPVGKNAASVQKCFRTSDIDEVGDESHLTFFEMLGNFSFGGYFKEKAIEYSHEFVVGKDWMNLEIDKVTIFDPAKVPADDWRACVPFDKESYEIWKKIGIPEVKIVREGIDNFWGPTGNEGPCGPTTEIYVKTAGGKSVEIWNIVFNEFYCDQNKKLTKLKIPGVDTGMGLERLAMVSQNVSTIFETDLFKDAFKRKFGGQSGHIFLDHVRGAMFLIADGVQPSNKEVGYILRRLMRRAIFHVRKLTGENEGGGFGLGIKEIQITIENGISFYGNKYPELRTNQKTILTTFKEEYGRFIKTLDAGFRELNRLHRSTSKVLGDYGSEKFLGELSAQDAFYIYQSFGFPREVMRDYCEDRGTRFDDDGFKKLFKKHQKISRAGAEKKFGGHGLMLDTGELKAADEKELKIVTRLHTATHMLQAALRQILGASAKQAGSDITVERTRFDFTFDRKLTPEEIKKVEDIVNEKIKEDLPMQKIVLPKSEAEKTGALYFFKEKYPGLVNVYFIGNSLETAWSKEFCGGPHVTHTGEIGAFKIAKEEAVGAGVRRIRGMLLQEK